MKYQIDPCDARKIKIIDAFGNHIEWVIDQDTLPEIIKYILEIDEAMNG